MLMEYRSHPLTKIATYRRNRLLFLSIIAGFLGLIAFQVAFLSIGSHEKYQKRAQDNLFDRRRLSYPRGNILDREGLVLATNRRVYAITFSPYGLRNDEARDVLARLAGLIGAPDASAIEGIIETRPRWTRHTLVGKASQVDVLPFLERPGDYPGVRIREDFSREYSQPTDFAHVIGYLGRIQPGELDTYTRPRYLLDAEVGRSGLERQYENRLAGHPGAERHRRDARGRRLSQPDLLESARPGENLYLATDARLQARAMELLRGRTGTILMMDVESGGLLVMASRPTFDPNTPSALVVDGEDAGFLNLAVRGLYPPASTFKMVGAVVAIKEGYSPSREVNCAGRFQPAGWGRAYYCSHRWGHGLMNLSDSIKVSCNTYYYQLGYDFGFAPFADVARRLGFAELAGVDLPGEKAGQLASMEQPPPGETLNLVIGQGSMLATPLQVLRATAAVANGGRLVTPHVVDSIGYDRETAEVIGARAKSAGLGPSEIRVITDGMWRAVNESGGTAHDAGFHRAWDVAGKTGTAERGGDKEDAWFAGFFPASRPRYAMIVHIENAESGGGHTAAPIAKDLLEEYFQPREEVAQRSE